MERSAALYGVGRTKLNAAKRISEELGRKVVFDGTMSVDKTGAIDPETGTIRLNARVGGPENLFDNALRLLEEQEAPFLLDNGEAGGYNSKEERLLLEAAGVGRAKAISEADRAKISNWTYPPKEDLYLKYKDVYDNPKFFNQATGNVIYPGMNDDVNIDGFVNGEYEMETLLPGRIIDRYGSNNGCFLSPEGTSYEARALPPFMEQELYTKYRILQPVEVKSGKIAPWFNQTGNGIQFLSNYSVDELIKMGIIEKVK